MKRSIVALVLATLVLGGTETGAESGSLLDRPDPQELIEYLQDIRKPPKRIVITGFYRRIGTTNQFVILCEASAYGGTALFTRITQCRVTGSNGGAARGVTPITYPGLEAITVGQGAFDTGYFTACISAEARYADGTLISVSGCEPAKKLEQGYI